MPHPTAEHLTLRWLPGRHAYCRLPAGAAVPSWALFGESSTAASGFAAVMRTEDELSIIAPEQVLPRERDSMKIESGFAAVRIVPQGKAGLDFNLVGILASLSGALAQANIPVCAISTFDTDILLIKAEHAADAAKALARIASFENEFEVGQPP